jgi:pimeloyl-ACP methyl ester carboxylesterase
MPLGEIEQGVRAAAAAVSQSDLRFQLAHLELPVPLDLPNRIEHLVGRLPILLISSRDDLIVPPRHTHWLSQHMPGVPHIEIEGGHAFFQHGGMALASQLRAFLPSAS